MPRVPSLRTLVVLAAVVSCASLAAAAPDPRVEEGKQKAKVAAAFVEAGTWFRDHGRKTEAQRAVAEAKEADAKVTGLDALAQAVDAMEPKEGDDPEATKRWQAVASDAAKAYEKAAAIDHEAKDDARFDGYLAKALELDPSKGRIAKTLAAAKQMAGNKARALSAGLLLSRLRDADKDADAGKKYDALEAEMAQSDVALVKAPSHPMVAWLSCPKGWTAKGDGKILVAVEGAGCNFLGACRGFAGGRGSRKFLVLTPVSLSNTNELKPETYPMYPPSLLAEWNGNRVEFDMAGLEAILGVVKTRYGISDKIAITGFSGGGNLCYSWTMRKPDRVFASAPACANFQPGLAAEAQPVTDGGPPVHILTGASDEHRNDVFGQKPGIEGQADWAQESFTKLGFTHVKRTMLPGVGHSSCGAQVWAFVDEVLGAK